MLKFLDKKRVILILLFLSFFLVLGFFVKANFSIEKFIQKLKLNKNSQLLAQALTTEIAPYFFPRFPQRLIYTLSEMEMIIKELVELNEGLNDLLKESDCKFALSQCLPKITFGGVGCTPSRVLGQPYLNQEKIETNKEEIADRIDNLAYLRELLIKEMEDGLEQELKTLRPEIAEELRNKIKEVLDKSEKIILVAKENKDLYSKDYTPNCKAACKPGPVCGIKACVMLGTGPQKQIEIKAKLGVSLDNLELGEVGLSKFNLALPDKFQFPIPDIVFTIPRQDIQVCFPFEPITISFTPPSLATLPTLNFTCPKLPTLKLPELKIPKLPKEIKIPFPEIPEIKFCPAIPEISGLKELEEIISKMKEAGEKEIGEFKNKIDEAINQINELIEKVPDPIKKELKKFKEDIQKEYEKVKEETEEFTEEKKTPPVEFETPEKSKEYQYQSPESKGLEFEDISLSYQCFQTAGDEKVETGAGTNWYFEILSWLMEECSKLPTISSLWGLKEKAANCYDPNKVIGTIVKECNDLWKNYIVRETPPLPAICQLLGEPCLERERAKESQCLNLFKQENEPIPKSCYLDVKDCGGDGCYCEITGLYEGKYATTKSIEEVIQTLKNKCNQLKDKGRKEIPLPCKILPLFSGKIEAPGSETYSGSTTTCPAQKLTNLPLGFGSGIGFNCPIGFSGLPKIVLPDIIIPDIILPEFAIPSFLRIKLPSIIIEDLILPDIDLCDLNNCAHIFPSLSFKFPKLNLPSLFPSVPISQLPGLQLRGALEFPSINFSLPQLNLFNLLLPELELPEIPIPSPKVSFAITGIDVSWIFELIFTFILNALDVPDFGYCIIAKLTLPSLSLVYPDYYFSFKKFPELPKIPFCEDVNQFCKKVKNVLGEDGWIKKAKEIETEFNKTINRIQKEIDKVSQLVNEELQNQINQIFEEYGQIIYERLVKQLQKSGLTLEDYISPRTGELMLPEEAPFPGVFPIGPGPDGKRCLSLPLPETNIIVRIVEKKNLPEKKVERKDRQIIVYLPIDLPFEIYIPWPEKLKKISLIKPLTYDLPEIPLKGLSYEKEFPIKGPGFQPRTFFFDFGKINEGDCLSKPPTGGNPIPVGQIISKLNEIKDIQSEIKDASQTIIRILE